MILIEECSYEKEEDCTRWAKESVHTEKSIFKITEMGRSIRHQESSNRFMYLEHKHEKNEGQGRKWREIRVEIQEGQDPIMSNFPRGN